MTLLYFAWVRQKIGKSEEQMALPRGLSTLGELAAHLAALGGGYAEVFSDTKRLRAAVNQVNAQWGATVHDGDEIAFFPPVTG